MEKTVPRRRGQVWPYRGGVAGNGRLARYPLCGCRSGPARADAEVESSEDPGCAKLPQGRRQPQRGDEFNEVRAAERECGEFAAAAASAGLAGGRFAGHRVPRGAGLQKSNDLQTADGRLQTSWQDRRGTSAQGRPHEYVSASTGSDRPRQSTPIRRPCSTSQGTVGQQRAEWADPSRGEQGSSWQQRSEPPWLWHEDGASSARGHWHSRLGYGCSRTESTHHRPRPASYWQRGVCPERAGQSARECASFAGEASLWCEFHTLVEMTCCRSQVVFVSSVLFFRTLLGTPRML